MTDRLWHHGAQYVGGGALDPAECDPDPIIEFRRWFAAAEAASLPAVNAMTLATIDDRGRPTARIVLLKEADARGFVFFTNYESPKARDVTAHPFAALVLFWEPLHRQIRIEGAVERIASADSDAYFASRPRGSQLGAIASPQSQRLATRGELEARISALAGQLGGATPPRPAYWGGFRVVPDMIELWQGQPSRLHDRVRYERTATGWTRDRLAP